MLKGFCEIVHFSLNAVIIVTYFVQSRHRVFMIAIVEGKCAILMQQTLQFNVCHRFYCLLIYDDSVILSCFILNCHRTFLFSQILNLFICSIFEHNFLQMTKQSITFKFWSLTISTATKFMLSNQATTERCGFIRGPKIVVREIMTLI